MISECDALNLYLVRFRSLFVWCTLFRVRGRVIFYVVVLCDSVVRLQRLRSGASLI